MSFTFGQFSFADFLPTSHAIQREFPNVSNLSIESLEVPGMERRRFLQTDRPFTGITFDVILHADTEGELETRRDQLVTLLDPALGPQPLVLDDHPDWYWNAAVSEEIVWEKLTWGCEYRGYRYRADIVFETYGDAASRHVEAGGLEVEGELVIPSQGTTRSWPRWEFSEPLPADQVVKFTVAPVLGAPQHDVIVEGPLGEGQTMVLDYDTMEFAVWEGTRKVASLVNRMSTLERPELHPILGDVQVSATVRRMDEYVWVGTPHASESIKRVDGVEVARNYQTSPSKAENLNFRISRNVDITSGDGPDDLHGLFTITDLSGAPYVGYDSPDVRPGQWVAFAANLAWDVGVETARYQLQFHGDSGAIESPHNYYYKSEYPENGRYWWVGQAPEGTLEVRPYIWWYGESYREDAVAGDTIWMDYFSIAIAATESKALAQVRTYFDGDTPGGYRNEGVTALFYPNSRRQ